eukprot:1176435-Prorocentrum_minimum.AAC.2
MSSTQLFLHGSLMPPAAQSSHCEECDILAKMQTWSNLPTITAGRSLHVLTCMLAWYYTPTWAESAMAPRYLVVPAEIKIRQLIARVLSYTVCQQLNLPSRGGAAATTTACL